MTRSGSRLARLTLIGLLAGTPALGDEVHEQLDAARRAYDGGDLRDSVQALQAAITEVQEKMLAKLRQLLPEPLPGWEADAPQSQTAGILTAIAGTNLSRHYFREDGADVEISIVADSPMIGMMSMLFASPFLMQATPGTTSFTRDGHRGLIEHAEGSSDWELKLMIGDQTLIQITGAGLDSEEPLQDYLAAMDLTAIEQAMAN